MSNGCTQTSPAGQFRYREIPGGWVGAWINTACATWSDAALGSSPPSFPAWAAGHWEDVFIEGSTLVLQDGTNFRTYSSQVGFASIVISLVHLLLQCVKQSPKNPERFLIYARTQW